MKKIAIVMISAVIIGIGSYGFSPALAKNAHEAPHEKIQNATFAIENMTCALCPVTVKKAMSRVEGVTSVEVDFDTKTALVKFNPELTSQAIIAAASTNVGYPAIAVADSQK